MRDFNSEIEEEQRTQFWVKNCPESIVRRWYASLPKIINIFYRRRARSCLTPPPRSTEFSDAEDRDKVWRHWQWDNIDNGTWDLRLGGLHLMRLVADWT